MEDILVYSLDSHGIVLCEVFQDIKFLEIYVETKKWEKRKDIKYFVVGANTGLKEII